MTRIRRWASRLIGAVQCIIGAAASVFVYLVYANPVLRAELSLTEAEIPLFILVFMSVSAVLVLSGIILVRDDR